jgi:hypothetical protein
MNGTGTTDKETTIISIRYRDRTKLKIEHRKWQKINHFQYFEESLHPNVHVSWREQVTSWLIVACCINAFFAPVIVMFQF